MANVLCSIVSDYITPRAKRDSHFKCLGTYRYILHKRNNERPDQCNYTG